MIDPNLEEKTGIQKKVVYYSNFLLSKLYIDVENAVFCSENLHNSCNQHLGYMGYSNHIHTHTNIYI